MSLDLSILPLDYDHWDWGFSHSVIGCGAAGAWHDRLKDVPRTPVPKDFSTYLCRTNNEGPHYGNTQQTPYGEPLTCVTVRQIVAAMNERGFWVMSRKDLAVWNYLLQLPSEQRVALYWH